MGGSQAHETFRHECFRQHRLCKCSVTQDLSEPTSWIQIYMETSAVLETSIGLWSHGSKTVRCPKVTLAHSFLNGPFGTRLLVSVPPGQTIATNLENTTQALAKRQCSTSQLGSQATGWTEATRQQYYVYSVLYYKADSVFTIYSKASQYVPCMARRGHIIGPSDGTFYAFCAKDPPG